MKRNKFAILLTLIAVTAGITAFWSSNTNAESKPPLFNPAALYKQAGESQADLLNFKNMIKGKFGQLNGVNPEEDIFVTVTLNRPISASELKTIVEKHGLVVNQIYGRAIESSGVRATLMVTPENGQFFNSETLDRMMNSNNAEFKGFIEIIANVKNKNLESLADDSLVFLVDPSADELLSQNPKKNPAYGAFWKLEDNKMISQ
ncbi:MAG: hypothetical protein ACQEXQ_14105 [Bacillota bacterium]